MRKLIFESFSDMIRKVNEETRLKVTIISFPVLVSYLGNPDDYFTHEEASIDGLEKCCQGILNCLEFYEPVVLDLVKVTLPRLQDLVQNIFHNNKTSNFHVKSDANFETAGIVDYYQK